MEPAYSMCFFITGQPVSRCSESRSEAHLVGHPERNISNTGKHTTHRFAVVVARFLTDPVWCQTTTSRSKPDAIEVVFDCLTQCSFHEHHSCHSEQRHASACVASQNGGHCCRISQLKMRTARPKIHGGGETDRHTSKRRTARRLLTFRCDDVAIQHRDEN